MDRCRRHGCPVVIDHVAQMIEESWVCSRICSGKVRFHISGHIVDLRGRIYASCVTDRVEHQRTGVVDRSHSLPRKNVFQRQVKWRLPSWRRGSRHGCGGCLSGSITVVKFRGRRSAAKTLPAAGLILCGFWARYAIVSIEVCLRVRLVTVRSFGWNCVFGAGGRRLTSTPVCKKSQSAPVKRALVTFLLPCLPRSVKLTTFHGRQHLSREGTPVK
jgi:hypothetical protein